MDRAEEMEVVHHLLHGLVPYGGLAETGAATQLTTLRHADKSH